MKEYEELRNAGEEFFWLNVRLSDSPWCKKMMEKSSETMGRIFYHY